MTVPMDFMKWISSLDEFLYEVASWLLFFPLTLWRTLTRPLAMMDYADSQLALPDDEQYGAALSPPLFLALALLLAHGVSAALGQADAIVADRHGLAGLIDDDASALVLRLVVFAAFPLLAAARLLRRLRVPLDRGSLRLPFYAQCYPIALFALGLNFGFSLVKLGSHPLQVGGLLLICGAFAYYMTVETRWFAAKLGTGLLPALGAMLLTLIEAFALLLIVGYLFTR
jgi:hypothetical protein